jgi:ParB family chromosome partitioning protein
MAKRKRLTPALAAGYEEAEMIFPRYPDGVAHNFTRAPVAQVAGDIATRAALDELATEMAAAREGGRMVLDLPLEAVEAGHLVRDRMRHDPEEMAALKASLAARGQQTPVEVVALGAGRFGLISGARRLAALAALHAETGEARFGRVLALARTPDNAQAAYVAMVEENEVRADLSFYERGRMVSEAAQMGLYPDPQAAVRALFASALPAKRSKILAFVGIHEALGRHLRFATDIPEKLGLALAAALGADPGLVGRLNDALRKTPASDAAGERRALERALHRIRAAEPPPEVAPGIALDIRKGRVVLSGPGVDAGLAAALTAWLKAGISSS